RRRRLEDLARGGGRRRPAPPPRGPAGLREDESRDARLGAREALRHRTGPGAGAEPSHPRRRRLPASPRGLSGSEAGPQSGDARQRQPFVAEPGDRTLARATTLALAPPRRAPQLVYLSISSNHAPCTRTYTSPLTVASSLPPLTNV